MDCDNYIEPILKPFSHKCKLAKSTRCAFCELGLSSIFNQHDFQFAKFAKYENLTNIKGKVKESFELIDGDLFKKYIFPYFEY